MRKMHGGFSFAGLREAFFVSFTAIFMNFDSVVTYGGAVRLNEGAVWKFKGAIFLRGAAIFSNGASIFLGLASVSWVLEVLEVSTIFLIPRLSVGLRVWQYNAKLQIFS